MLSIVKSMALHGLDGYLIDVQVDVSARNATLGNCRSSRCNSQRSQRKSKNSNKEFWF